MKELTLVSYQTHKYLSLMYGRAQKKVESNILSDSQIFWLSM